MKGCFFVNYCYLLINLSKYLQLIGIHPHEAKSWEDSYYNELKDIAKNPECVAIGICGLDYNKDFSSPDIQRKVFELQVITKICKYCINTFSLSL